MFIFIFFLKEHSGFNKVKVDMKLKFIVSMHVIDLIDLSYYDLCMFWWC